LVRMKREWPLPRSGTPHPALRRKAKLRILLLQAYVAAHLSDADHNVEVIDFNISGLNPRRVALALKRLSPGLVGISAHTETYPNALRIAELVKIHDPSIPVVMGGPHASILPVDVLAHSDVDFVVIGEGERTAIELAGALESGAGESALREIAGLGYKTSGTITMNSPREPLDAALVGRPARHLLTLDFYEDAFNVLTARGGCPYKCPFCSASHLWGGRRRSRPVEDIMAEVLDMFVTYGARHIFFVDDIFTLNRKWLGELLDLLAARPADLTWSCATRVDLVDQGLLERMAAAGCVGMQYGVESGAQSILDSVKSIKKEDAIETSCSFMVPFPEDTEETLAETLALMKVLKDAGGNLLMSFTTPYPGTMFYDRAEELGLRILEDDWEFYDAKQLVMETKFLSRERIGEIAAAMAAELGMAKSV